MRPPSFVDIGRHAPLEAAFCGFKFVDAGYRNDRAMLPTCAWVVRRAPVTGNVGPL
jgi:hypothetical protein